MIQLIGPGGAGKSTIGARLAEQLAIRFIDLDAEFVTRHGNISAYLDSHGYEAYAARNVGLYSDLVDDAPRPAVMALSSGFMTYADDIHPAYLARRQRLASSPSTFVLIPSVDLETCVAETVRRQLERPFARPAPREEEVIRERFPLYMRLPSCKIETMPSIETVVAELVSLLAAAHKGPSGCSSASRRHSPHDTDLPVALEHGERDIANVGDIAVQTQILEEIALAQTIA
jgi:shikimate kinase